MLDDDNPLSLALQKAFLVDIYDVLAMPFHDIDRLEYVDDQGKVVMLPNGYRYMIRIIKHYDSYRTADGDPIGDNWKTVTADQYNEYHLSADYANVSSLSSSSPARGTLGCVQLWPRLVHRTFMRYSIHLIFLLLVRTSNSLR
jgi:hypothetical protein